MGRTGPTADDSGEPPDNGGRREVGGRRGRPGGVPAEEDESGRPEGRRIVEVHGSDVQAGPEVTDQPRAGATEPPD